VRDENKRFTLSKIGQKANKLANGWVAGEERNEKGVDK
jgi:hypothetical protein